MGLSVKMKSIRLKLAPLAFLNHGSRILQRRPLDRNVSFIVVTG
jgi:hypothetical protein